MNIENELQKYNVSRETQQRLIDFVAILTEWNAKMNLVSKNSLTEVWGRHVFDSLQLVQYLPTNFSQLVDIGSGAGFPGVVLAIYLSEKNPGTKVSLVESIGKKAQYLQDVCSRLGLTDCKIINNRAENEKFSGVDVITARAVAVLPVLCNYGYSVGDKNAKMLLLKGRTYEDELSAAKRNWQFDYRVYPNLYCDDGVVLELFNLRKRK